MKTALVTGGSRGIGAGIVKALCRAGYGVTFLYRSNEEAAQAVSRETGADAVCCNVADSAQVEKAVKSALSRWKHIDLLVNCAGIAQSGLLTDVTDGQWHAMLDTHLTGAFYLCRAVLPGMLQRQSGCIVNISSIWGQAGAACEVSYSAAKAGLIGFTKALAKEAGPGGVRVNCVCPGVIETDMLNCYTADDLEDLKERTPLGRLGTPQDVAGCVLWLAGTDAGFVTGQVIGVGGGFGE